MYRRAGLCEDGRVPPAASCALCTPRSSRDVSAEVEALVEELGAWARAAGLPVETHAYGPDPEHVADLRLPSSEGPHPVVVVVHGGFWRSTYTRSSTHALSVDLTTRGYATWNIEYRRVGEGGGVPETLDDVAAAIRHLATIDGPLEPGPPAVIGHSAGGHLALWAGGAGLASAVVSLAGVCDLTSASRDGIGDGAATGFVGGTPDERPEGYDLADPARRLPTGVPTLLVHGDVDDRVPVEQSREHVARAVAAGDPCRLLELPGVGHFEVIDPRSAAWAEIAAQLTALVPPSEQDVPR